MAWTDFEGGLGDIVPSPRESRRFGYSIARLSVGTAWRQTATTVEQLGHALWARVAAAEADIVIVRFPSKLAQLPAPGTVLPGWTIIPAGSIVYWSCETRLAAAEPPSDDGMVIVRKSGSSQASAELDVTGFDITEFLNALDDSFTDYTSHYTANPLLDSTLVTAGYREWAESNLNDPEGQMYAWTVDGRMIGVAVSRTLNVRGGGGGSGSVREIELAGMISDAQGRGRYRHLLNAVVHDAHADGVGTVVISTQSHNIRVQRAWASAGFKPERSIDTLHAVRTSLLRQDAG